MCLSIFINKKYELRTKHSVKTKQRLIRNVSTINIKLVFLRESSSLAEDRMPDELLRNGLRSFPKVGQVVWDCVRIESRDQRGIYFMQ